ncbi:PQQ-binding-like beta-propeller repeat protein [Telmatocola sphagniphila]|uniref:PQQ-binding-like beta-propeller repeat protein n=1 Tax=Telmatocola sphagniphila TaxID=1123043 RepID=A0A8E6ETA7_9BACT|nr:PQQ-binding-like beta-propeller repeat protein [Telmatocola sphagniphila]QVL29830.1 PQQ-binding-like beta-propeller repeat protein [Telmatocola sphagniphila]
MKKWALLSVFLLGSNARADDWPQWMGPQRDNIWREKGILEKFPKEGPNVLWRAEVGGGYAGPAVAEGKVFVTDFITKDNVKVDNFARKPNDGTERVLCLDEKTGKELWKYEYPVRYAISYPAGPRCTPEYRTGKVYNLGAEGNLVCLDAATGKVIWSHDLKAEYKTKSALWGYAGHPLIDGKKLITLVGGNGSHVAAFDIETGKEIWKARTSPANPGDGGQGYSPPTIIQSGGTRQLIVMAPNAVTSLDPETGKEFWTTPYEATNNSIIMTPLVFGDYLFVGGYLNKNLLLKLNKEKPGVEVVWKDKQKYGISPLNVQPMLVDNVIYGMDSNGTTYAVEMPSGKRLWETAQPVATSETDRPAPCATAFIVKNEDRYFFFTEKGELVIGKLSPKGYEEIDRTKLLTPTNNAFGHDVLWCAPAYANKHIYVRNDKEIICVDLSK